MNAEIDVSQVVLKTERLTLRPWKESDLEDGSFCRIGRIVLRLFRREGNSAGDREYCRKKSQHCFFHN